MFLFAIHSSRFSQAHTVKALLSAITAGAETRLPAITTVCPTISQGNHLSYSMRRLNRTTELYIFLRRSLKAITTKTNRLNQDWPDQTSGPTGSDVVTVSSFSSRFTLFFVSIATALEIRTIGVQPWTRSDPNGHRCRQRRVGLPTAASGQQQQQPCTPQLRPCELQRTGRRFPSVSLSVSVGLSLSRRRCCSGRRRCCRSCCCRWLSEGQVIDVWNFFYLIILYDR